MLNDGNFVRRTRSVLVPKRILTELSSQIYQYLTGQNSKVNIYSDRKNLAL